MKKKTTLKIILTFTMFLALPSTRIQAEEEPTETPEVQDVTNTKTFDELKDLIDFARAFENEYLGQENQNLLDAIVKAETVYKDTTENELDSSYDALESALQSAQDSVNKFSLNQAKEDAEVKLNENLQDKHKDILTGLIEQADALLGDVNATESDVNALTTELTTEIDSAKTKADKGQLEAAIVQAKKESKENLTQESRALLDEAVKNAKLVLEQDDATVEEVKSAHDNLVNVIDGLNYVLSKDDLIEMIDHAKEVNRENLSEKQIQNLDAAIEQAKQVANNENATKADIGLAQEDLKTAINATINQPSESTSKMPLLAFSRIVAVVDQSTLTSQSKNNLDTLMPIIQKVLNNPNASDAEIMEANRMKRTFESSVQFNDATQFVDFRLVEVELGSLLHVNLNNASKSLVQEYYNVLSEAVTRLNSPSASVNERHESKVLLQEVVDKINRYVPTSNDIIVEEEVPSGETLPNTGLGSLKLYSSFGLIMGGLFLTILDRKDKHIN